MRPGEPRPVDRVCLAQGRRSTPLRAPAQLAAAERVPQARVIDMASVLCLDGKQCPAVIGNVLVYRSGTHISDTYAATTTPMLSASLNTATDGLLGSD